MQELTGIPGHRADAAANTGRRRAAPFARAAVGVALALLSSLSRAGATVAQAPADTLRPAESFAALVEARRSDADDARTRREGALESLARASPALVRALLEQSAASGEPDERASAALFVLARLGQPDDVALALRLQRPGAERELELAILGIALRDANAWNRLDALVPGASDAARAACAAAAERIGSTRAALHLARWCRGTVEMRREGLARLGRMARRLPRPLPDELPALVREVLAGAQTECLSAAIVATGRIGDSDAIPHLVALLAHESSGVRAEARWALERISGLRLGERPARWLDWYQSESEWKRTQSEVVFAALRDGTSGERIRALLDIGRRHAWRDRLAQRIAESGVLGEESEVAALAADTLGLLGSNAACRELVHALEHDDEGVAHKAWLALGKITGRSLPPDADAWQAVLAP